MKLIVCVLLFIILMLTNQVTSSMISSSKEQSAKENTPNIIDSTSENLTNEVVYPKADEPLSEIKSMIFIQYVLLGWITLFVIIIGLVGNLFTIKVLLHPNMKSPINTHFIGLAFSDLASLMTILFVIPLRYILVSHRVLWYHEFHAIIFPYLYPVTILFQFNSIFLTVAASVCRCLTIYCSNTSQIIYTIKNSIKIVISIFVIGFILAIPYWFRYQTFKYFNPNTNQTEYHVIDKKIDIVERIHVVLTTSCYSIPLIILCVANVLLILVLLKSRRRKQNFGLANLNEIKTTVVLIVMIITFFLCNMPNFLMNILSISKILDGNSIPMMKLHQWANFLLITNYSSNFAIYCLFGENFRNTAKLIFQSKRVATQVEKEMNLKRTRAGVSFNRKTSV